MAGFAPQLNGGVGFVQAQGGDAGGLGVLSSLTGSLLSKPKAARAPSEDERNAALWQDMYPDQDIAEASMGQLRSFGKRNPSAADWGVSTAEATLNQNVADFTAATESERTISTKLREDWATSPDGVVAQNTASSIEDEGERTAYLATSHADWMGRQVQAQVLTEETQQYGVNAKRRDEMWTLEGFNMKGGADTVATAMTDAVESMMLNPSATINLDDTGITAAIPQLAGTVLTRDNAPMVMETFRSAYMDNQTRRIAGAYGITGGELGQMPDAVRNQVFGKFDSTLTWLTKEVDPAQIKKRLDNNAYLKMIEAGVPLDKINAISLATKGNPELTSAVTASLVGDVGAVMQAFENGDFDGALQSAQNLSKQERDRSFAGFSELAKVWGGTSSAGEVYAEVPEAMRGVGFASATMSAFTVAQAESGDTPLVLGKNWYKQNVESQGQAYALAAKHDPNFEPAMVKNLSSDLSTNIEMLRTEASKQGFVPTMENGNIVLVHGGPTHDQKMAAFEAAIVSTSAQDPAAVAGVEANRDAYLNTTPTAMNLDIGDKNVDVLGDAVYKFNALKNLGNIGSQVRDLTTADFNLVDAEAEAVAADAMKTISDQKIIDAGGIITTELPPQAQDVVANFEGFSKTAYWDVNAWRTGYGSDTVTLADGTIKKVTQDTVVNEEDAKRDLARRTVEFEETAIRNVGQDAWDGLADNVKSALVSVAYNYGSLPTRIRDQVKSGDVEAIAKAIEGLAGDNDGVNSRRRFEEAAIVRGNYSEGSASTDVVSTKDQPAAPETSLRPVANPVAGTTSAPETSLRPEARPTESSEAFSASAASVNATSDTEVSKSLSSVAQRVTDTLSPKAKRQLKSLGIEASEVDIFETQEEAQEAINSGELKEGDAMIVDGELFIVEGA